MSGDEIENLQPTSWGWYLFWLVIFWPVVILLYLNDLWKLRQMKDYLAELENAK